MWHIRNATCRSDRYPCTCLSRRYQQMWCLDLLRQSWVTSILCLTDTRLGAPCNKHSNQALIESSLVNVVFFKQRILIQRTNLQHTVTSPLKNNELYKGLHWILYNSNRFISVSVWLPIAVTLKAILKKMFVKKLDRSDQINDCKTVMAWVNIMCLQTTIWMLPVHNRILITEESCTLRIDKNIGAIFNR